MTPEKVLIQYMIDVSNQQKVCLKANNIEDSKELQLILNDFKISIKLLRFWRNKKIIKNAS
jgi:hypothetical protein